MVFRFIYFLFCCALFKRLFEICLTGVSGFNIDSSTFPTTTRQQNLEKVKLSIGITSAVVSVSTFPALIANAELNNKRKKLKVLEVKLHLECGYNI